jgi:hypothetical protein
MYVAKWQRSTYLAAIRTNVLTKCGNGGVAASWFSEMRDSAPGPQGGLNRPSSIIPPGVGRRRRPIDGLSIGQTDSYVIDQTVTVAFAGLEQQQAARVAELAPVLDRYGGTAGLLVEEAGPLARWPGVDALIVSTDNAMT